MWELGVEVVFLPPTVQLSSPGQWAEGQEEGAESRAEACWERWRSGQGARLKGGGEERH